jgi:hypothetical protein
MQGEMFREAQHGGIRVRIVVERIALSETAERAQSVREFLVACLVGTLVRLFGLPLTANWGLVRLVVGIGIVVFAHSCAIITANPATLQFLIPPEPIMNKINIPPRSGLVQQDVDGNPH